MGGRGSLKDGLAATKTGYSSGVPRLDPQHPCDDLQWYAVPVLGIWPPLASVNTMHAWTAQHINRQNTHILIKNIKFEKLFTKTYLELGLETCIHTTWTT